ncbi:hypothetical protein RDI58_015205 [Solanum bulbocastanum]
MEVLI